MPALAVLFLALTVLPVKAGEQPHMTAALEFLHQARDGSDKLPLLHAAKKELEIATNNKEGFRVEAIKLVNHAIVEGENGRRAKMEEDIAAAITLVHDGIAAAR